MSRTIAKLWLAASVAIAAAIMLGASCNAEAMRVRVTTQQGMSQGTCFSVGKTDDGQTVMITAAHVIGTGGRIEVAFGGTWHPVQDWAADATTDVGILQARIPTKNDLDLRDADGEQPGEIWGFGPEYHGRRAVGFTGTLTGSRFYGDGGLHAITGDSGGPVVIDGAAVGVVSSIRWRASHRAQYSDRDATTEIVPAATVRQVLAQYYTPQDCQGGSCGPNGCPIYLRPQIQQPRILGIIPAGPPRVVGVTPPIDSIGIVTTPMPQRSTPPGATPSASDGTADSLRRALEDLIRKNPDLLRGPAGPPGPAGTQQPLRVILARDGKKIDEELIQPGEPLILDVQSFGGGK